MTKDQRRLFPVNARLEDWHQHCQIAHGATANDYKRNVVKWHRKNHPACDFTAFARPPMA